MERFLVRAAGVPVRRNEDIQKTQSPSSPSSSPKTKVTHPATIEKWKLDWLGVETGRDKKTRIFCKACRTCVGAAGQRAVKVVNPALASADFIKGSENVKKYVAFRHQATKQHGIAYGE